MMLEQCNAHSVCAVMSPADACSAGPAPHKPFWQLCCRVIDPCAPPPPHAFPIGPCLGSLLVDIHPLAWFLRGCVVSWLCGPTYVLEAEAGRLVTDLPHVECYTALSAGALDCHISCSGAFEGGTDEIMTRQIMACIEGVTNWGTPGATWWQRQQQQMSCQPPLCAGSR
jgi:hypothetical protein